VFIIEAAPRRRCAIIIADGFGFDLAGGIPTTAPSISSTASLPTMSSALMPATSGRAAGIYSGNNTLNVQSSTVSNNHDTGRRRRHLRVLQRYGAHQNSTVSGNVAGNVGGGIRMLGNATIVNSTLSGNTSSAWFGGALFHTDGVANLVNSTVTANVAPSFSSAALFVGTHRRK
jgi:hypothetical protein